jgi:hypothetical protein
VTIQKYFSTFSNVRSCENVASTPHTEGPVGGHTDRVGQFLTLPGANNNREGELENFGNKEKKRKLSGGAVRGGERPPKFGKTKGSTEYLDN